MGLIGWIVSIPFILIGLLMLAVLFFEGRKAYWDNKVRQMCEKDGGVVIFDKVYISKGDIDLLGRNDGKIAVPTKDLAHVNAPVYSESKTAYLRDANPKVWRKDVSVIRRADQKTIAKWVFYSRVGGDFPTFGHPSYFGCPDLKIITSDLERIFIVKGDSK